MSLFKQMIFGTSHGSAPAISAQEVQTMLKSENKPFLLDVRQPDEFKEARIPEAKLIPLGELAARHAELPRDREIICVCRSGARSSSAAAQLARLGFTVKNLNGGLISWMQAGLPVKRG